MSLLACLPSCKGLDYSGLAMEDPATWYNKTRRAVRLEWKTESDEGKHEMSNRPVSRREVLRTSLFLSAAVLMSSRSASAAALPGMVVPLESGPHTRTWMAWPHLATVWGEDLSAIQEDIARVARTIAAY